MSADLIRVRFSGKAIFQFARAGRISPELANKVERIGENILHEAGKLAEKAARSTVPIDTGALRQDIIFEGISSFTDTAVVSVQPRDHKNRLGISFKRTAGTGTQIGSPALADLLNVGSYKRSRPPLAEQGFSAVSGTTSGWENEARNQFVIALRRMIASAK